MLGSSPVESAKFGLASVQDFCLGGDLDQLPDIAADVMKKRYGWFENALARPFEQDRLGWPTNFRPSHLSGDSYLIPVASVLEAIAREACAFEKQKENDKVRSLERFYQEFQAATTSTMPPPPPPLSPPTVSPYAAILTYGDLSLSLVSCRLCKLIKLLITLKWD